jgi:hypothetical protein
MNRIVILFIITGWFITTAGFSGTLFSTEDSASIAGKRPGIEKPEPIHRNVIKFNPTPMLLWNKVGNITFSYERLIAKDMSLGLQAGYLILPKILSDTVAGLITLTDGKKSGVNLAFDFRYYPLSRNRRPAPDGLYLGGFLSYYGFRFSNNLDVLYSDLDENGSLSGRLNVVNLGVSLGYQFIFWKRFSLDMLMFGPSLSYYHGSLGIKGNLDPGEIQDIDEDLVNALLEQYPWLSLLFSQEKLEFTGSQAKISFGLRYSIQIGFHF